MVPIDVVKPSDAFVKERLDAVMSLFDTLPEAVRETYVSGKDRVSVPVGGVISEAIEKRDFVRLRKAVSDLNESVSSDDDNVRSSVVTGLMLRLVDDAEFAFATDIYAKTTIVFDGYVDELEKNGRDGAAGAVKTCLRLNRVLSCIEDRAYGTARRITSDLAERLAESEDPDVRAWMVAELLRASYSLRRMDPGNITERKDDFHD